MKRALNPAQYQAACHRCADQSLRLHDLQLAQIPLNSDGSKDAGPVIQGGLSALLQFIAFNTDRDEARIRADLQRLTGEILPQVLMAKAAGAFADAEHHV